MIGLLRRHPSTAALLAYLALALLAAWPLLAALGTCIGGDGDHAWHRLWVLWWWKDSLARGASPFVTDALRFPHAMPLGLESWSLPAALAALPLWAAVPTLPEVALHNLLLLASLALAAFTMYLLAREIWGDGLGAVLAGALYAVGAQHMGHGTAQPHAVSMVWPPLYFLGLARTVRRPHSGGPIAAGLGLALATTASPYHLAICAAGSAVLLAAWTRSDHQLVFQWAFLRRALLLAGVFLLATGWLWAGVLRAGVAPGPGEHGAASCSADLGTLLLPGPSHLSYVSLGLAALAVARVRAARAWLWLALAGAVLSLGATLRFQGRALLPQVVLPYGWLERAFPLAPWGCPASFSWLAAFGLAVAGAAALADLARLGRRGWMVACALAALGLAETWPRSPPTSAFPSPRFLRDLSRDAERWGVLDASAPPRRLYNQVLHRHPQVGGPATRAPARLDRWLEETPVLRPFFGPGGRLPPRDEAVRALQDLEVRFVIVDRERLPAARELALPLAYQGDGLWIYEVPARPAG